MESLIRGKLKKDSNMQPLRKGFRTSLSSGSVEAKVTFGSATFHPRLSMKRRVAQHAPKISGYTWLQGQ